MLRLVNYQIVNCCSNFMSDKTEVYVLWVAGFYYSSPQAEHMQKE